MGDEMRAHTLRTQHKERRGEGKSKNSGKIPFSLSLLDG